ncbi:MAG TPA: FAD binding domain-containing protein [Thermoanaerobaculia bacterium]|nr:FAD binding domain-containing protein [Thermoanaerobaculia bacterium]
MRDYVLFFINGREQRARGSEVFRTLSSYLRYDLGKTGTKIVCEEGDCGACSVLLGRIVDGDFRYEPVNSCILALGQLDGTSIVSVEGLNANGELNAVQESMIVSHGAQCGYCTPGFIVAMSALFESKEKLTEKDVRDGLTGNLCRCTGYEPIVKAALGVDGKTMAKIGDLYPAAPMLAAIRAARSEGGVAIEASGRAFAAPDALADAIRFKSDHAPVTILQGGTDVGVWVNKRDFTAPAILSLANVDGLDELRVENGAIIAGAKVTLAAFERFVEERIPELFGILNVFGSPQIKNAGTLVGNIANGSPIGDTLPYLLVAEAKLELTGAKGSRVVEINSFYKGYKQFDLAADEIITRVIAPIVTTRPSSILNLYKISRRKDLDISAFTAAMRLRIERDVIAQAWIAYGGVAPTVVRMPKTEAFVTGKVPSLELFERAGAIARGEITPISDVRGSREYRSQLAENIMARFWYDAFDLEQEALSVQTYRGMA